MYVQMWPTWYRLLPVLISKEWQRINQSERSFELDFMNLCSMISLFNNSAKALKECSISDGWAKHDQHGQEVTDYSDCFDTTVS